MARAAPPGALELLLHKVTDPGNSEENWEAIQRFSDQVNAEADGPSVALRLLEHKIQSPQEIEALRALTVLEMCVNHCGESFHHEMGKFRFLNGLIKVLSPKYLGSWSTEQVKSRIVETLFSWTVWFPEEVKIRDAYQMLKKQGIVKQDPKLPEDRILPPPSPRPAGSIFDADNEKSQLLARLLKSKNPEDLQAANRLIKGLIKEEQEKSAKVSRRMNAVKEAHNSAVALEEMLRRNKAKEEPAMEALEELRAKCEKLKPLMFRVASETVEDEEALAEILQANDRLIQVLALYNQVVGSRCGDPEPISAETSAPSSKILPLIDFSEQGPERIPSSPSAHLLDEEMMSVVDLPSSPVSIRVSEGLLPLPNPDSLATLFVPLESITLSTIPAVTIFAENGLQALLHFSRTPLLGFPSVRPLVLSLLSTAPHPVQGIVFQAAVPKSMAIKLQPATGSELPAFNPFLPPSVISQVLLLSNPQKAPLRLRYRLLFTQNGESHSKLGEVSNFPHEDLWASN
ncbi:ADP-ribosylation factor-binding protein GGA2 [Anolis carolinensis]|uniref:ADP-ribosylation factor-binding protein GGA2 n=1 Tax=Anolis carolinensis TaxID=28377 RepID=UPI00046265FB|nr:PREDICTED: ADP-ribosylation factor-binding protein GGA2 [Anolis carolinensis]|eukprot:XP_008123335.1 PREDICTED: ADP-ribosylation factor-binding protein GGA2 [Anolis carolinensis]